MSNSALTLINSEHFRDGGVNDRLNEEEWVEQFLARYGIEHPVSRTRHSQLRKLREVLRKIVEQITAKNSISDSALNVLNDFLEPSTLQYKVVRSQAGSFERQNIATKPGAPAATIASDFVKLLVDGDWRRLRICANDTCRWAFYDESRNRTRIWCDSTRCGNVMKVRRFRERKQG